MNIFVQAECEERERERWREEEREEKKDERIAKIQAETIVSKQKFVTFFKCIFHISIFGHRFIQYIDAYLILFRHFSPFFLELHDSILSELDMFLGDFTSIGFLQASRDLINFVGMEICSNSTVHS